MAIMQRAASYITAICMHTQIHTCNSQ